MLACPSSRGRESDLAHWSAIAADMGDQLTAQAQILFPSITIQCLKFQNRITLLNMSGEFISSKRQPPSQCKHLPVLQVITFAPALIYIYV